MISCTLVRIYCWTSQTYSSGSDTIGTFDWDLERILWIDGELKETAYQLTTVTYGTKAAPFLAVRALLQLVDDEGHRCPLAVPSLKHGRYVDDIFGGADSTQELIEIAQQLKALCNAGGFPLAKWHSTTPELLKAVSWTGNSSSIISLDDCITKILALKWLPHEDKFIFSSKFDSPPQELTFCLNWLRYLIHLVSYHL